jgi:bile salt-stimulated lipase
LIVKTTAGLIRGEFVDSSYFSFKGIRYAEAPVGNLRFRSPVPKKSWNGIRDTTQHGSFCANKFGFFGLTQQAGGSEDCLFLNVYSPNLKGKFAVMFWIHGGAFMSGNGDSELYGPKHLVGEDVVLVTINYRLSAFGFLTTGDENAPGNQGLKDIVLALQWVQENIENFGGNRNKVTIFGHSAGSVSVDYLMMSDMTTGLFHQAILQSGSSLMPCLFQPDPKPMAENLGRKLGLEFNSTKELVEKLREVDYKAIVDAETPLFEMGMPWGLTPVEFAPNVDSASLGKESFFAGRSPEEIFLSKNYRDIPMMVGSPNLEVCCPIIEVFI